MTVIPPFQSEAVEMHFDTYPPKPYKALLQLRSLIFQVAKEHSEIGVLQETLKWSEPSYLPEKPKIGTTIRLDWKEKEANNYFMYVNCKTSLIADIKNMYGDTFKTVGNRALLLTIGENINTYDLMDCIYMALTYHLNKK